jgi:hypothetical protein
VGTRNSFLLIAIAEAQVRLEQPSIQSSEGAGLAEIRVLLTGTLDVSVTVK